MTDPTKLTLDDWIAALDRSDAQLAAGNTVPMAPVLQRLRDSIERLEARQQTAPPRPATPRR
jgi:hypothetical protein